MFHKIEEGKDILIYYCEFKIFTFRGMVKPFEESFRLDFISYQLMN